jgi:succinate dehydrogenase/fumarate reductase-like Fe-S protein
MAAASKDKSKGVDNCVGCGACYISGECIEEDIPF